MPFTIVHEQKPGDPELPALLQQAVDTHQKGELNIAAPLYRQFLAQYTNHPTALQLLGLLHSQLGEYELGIDLMRESLRQFPEQAEVANNLGNALSSSGRFDEATESYAKAVKLYPRYADAWRNLGICHLNQEQPQESAIAFKRCLEIRPTDALSWLGLGNAMQQQKNAEHAINCYEKALMIDPDYAEAHHNLGVSLRSEQRSTAAIEHYRKAQQLGLDNAELYQNMGSAQDDAGDIDAAIDAYKAALERDPEDMVSHRNLNSLLWEQERLEEHLQSYRKALQKRPGVELLGRAYAIALNQAGNHDDAEQVLRRGLRYTPDSSELMSQLAYTLERQQCWDQALEMHAVAISTAGSTVNQKISYVRALLACQRPDEALPLAEQTIQQTPFDQRAIAYLGICWRILGDDKDAILNDYEKFVQVYDLPVSEQYVDAKQFNKQLSSVLNELHVSKRHPPEQTLRGGTQTHGDLFNQREPEIQDLVSGLKQCVHEYIELMPPATEHPLTMRRSKSFEFSASWSVRLYRGGYHTMHVHPLGWISSAYYVQLPDPASSTESNEGSIKFGEPDIDIGEYGKPRRIINPTVGQLVLFPSYMWHGTIPFESDQARMTVAFDVVPVHDSQ